MVHRSRALTFRYRDVVTRVASGHQAIQHAWAISYCKEHPIHLFHKRMLAARLDFGDADFHLEAVARVIGLR